MDLNSATLKKLYIHYTGNKNEELPFRLSRKKTDLGEDTMPLQLVEFYLRPFMKSQEFYTFHHPTNLKYNELYSFVSDIFDNPDNLKKISGDITEHLYEKSSHPKIRPGELHLAFFTGCNIEEENTEVLGIFKTESKTSFLKINQADNTYDLNFDEGIPPSGGFDKGCLIFNTGKKEGYKLVLLDNQSKAGEAQYWKDDFLKVKACADDFHLTKNYMSLCKEFVTKGLPQDFETTKTEQIDLLNRSAEYFKKNHAFEEKEFTKAIFDDAAVTKSFRNFKNDFAEQNNLDIEDNFAVSTAAVQKQVKVFKSVLKLDRNFHIYIHGDRQLIEKGVDSNGKKFYKIYYEKEV